MISIAHNKPTIGFEEEQAAIRVLRSGWLAQGKEVELFENEICAYLGLPERHAVAVSSGTAALFLALWTLGAKGNDVAFPAYACSALRNAVAMAGGNEILLDNGPDSPNVDCTAVMESGAPIAIVPHMFGIPADMADMPDVTIVEDCAQSLGAAIDGIPVGLHGTVGVFSLYASKLITSGGQGGIIVSKDRDRIEAIRDYRQFDSRHDHSKRFNFQMTDLQAAIGREQLKKLPSFLQRRAEIFSRYQQAGITLLDAQDRSRITPVRYRAVMRTEHPQKVLASLESVGARAIVPVEDWELLGAGSLFPQAHSLCRSTVSLPLYPLLTDDHVETVLKKALDI